MTMALLFWKNVSHLQNMLSAFVDRNNVVNFVAAFFFFCVNAQCNFSGVFISISFRSNFIISSQDVSALLTASKNALTTVVAEPKNQQQRKKNETEQI